MINLGVRAHDFGKQGAEELADKIQEYRFSCIQLALAKALKDFNQAEHGLSPGYGNYLRNIFRAREIDVAILGCYINPIHPDPELRESALRRFEEHLRFARDFGCAIVATETGSCNPDCSYHPRTDTEEVFLEFVAVIKRLVRTAEAYGTIIGVEGVSPKHCINTHERMVRLLELVGSPNLQVVYDPANFIPAYRSENHEAHMAEAFDLFGDKIVAVHVKDFRVVEGRKDTGLPSGRGVLNHRYLFELLAGKKPGIHVLLENNTPETMPGTAAFIRSILEQIPGA